jgi:succinyl-CoA synthetase beta subunit
MKIHEYQAKSILAKYNVPVPRGQVAFTVAEAEAAAEKIGGVVVVKAQIHAGGRGKGGGVKVAKTLEDAKMWSEKILGMTLVTHQTGPEGRVVKRLLIEEGLPIDKELYLGMVLDRAAGKIVFMASAAWKLRKWLTTIPTRSSRNLWIPALDCNPIRRAIWRSESACLAPRSTRLWRR